jgi:Protein of unknown function (DUF2934)
MADIRGLESSKQNLPTHKEIEERAHQIYLKRGGHDGRDVDDWLAAEAELAEERQTAPESSSLRSKTATAGTFGGAAKSDK